MVTKVFRYLLVTLIVILINVSLVAAVPSHKNVDEMSYDAQDLILYFQRCVDEGTFAFSQLAIEMFSGADAPISSMNSMLSPVCMVASPVSPPGSQLYTYYTAVSGFYDFLALAQHDMANIQSGLQILAHATDPPSHPDLMVSLRERIDLLAMDAAALMPRFQSLASLGIDTVDLLGAYSAFTVLLKSYDQDLYELERLYGTSYTFFIIRASSLDESGIIDVSGLFYIAGSPVTENAAVLYANGSVVLSGKTDSNGHIVFSYRLPQPILSSSISFYAQSAVEGTVYTSNTVSLTIEIPTFLSMDKSYSIDGDTVAIQVYGNLSDVFGGTLAGKAVVFSVNGDSYMAVTGPEGAYSHALTLPFEDSLAVTAYAEFFPELDEPYLYARSHTLHFSIVLPHELIDREVPSGVSDAARAAQDNIAYILSAAGLVAIIAFVVAYLTRRTKRSGTDSHVPFTTMPSAIPVGERELFVREISVLQRVGNTKEAIVVGYGALIGMLDRVGILSLHRDSTHLDIDSTLRSLPYTKPDAPLITKAFELSRYSPFAVGRRTYDAFIRALHSVSERIGEKR